MMNNIRIEWAEHVTLRISRPTQQTRLAQQPEKTRRTIKKKAKHNKKTWVCFVACPGVGRVPA